MSYKWNEPARPVGFKESTIVAALKKGPLLAIPKADGVRLHIVFNESAQVFLRSRSDLPFPALRELEARANMVPSSYRSELAGCTGEFEIVGIHPDGNQMTAAQTAGMLASNVQVHSNQFRLYHFDTYHTSIAKQGKEDRVGHMWWAISEFTRQICSGSVAALRGFYVHTLGGLMDAYAGARIGGWEGLVVVKPGEPYANGKKVGAGWKVKPEETQDGTIVALKEAFTEAGSPMGRVGSFLVAYEDGTEGWANAGRLTHDERIAMWNYPAEYIGRCVEVAAMEKNPTGGLRHPGFHRWRDMPHAKGIKI